MPEGEGKQKGEKSSHVLSFELPVRVFHHHLETASRGENNIFTTS